MDLYIGCDLSSNCIGITFVYGGKTEFISLLNRWEYTSAKIFDKAKLFKDYQLLQNLVAISNFELLMFDRIPNGIPSKKKLKAKKSDKDFLQVISEWESTHFQQCEMLATLFKICFEDKIKEIKEKNNISKIYCCIESLAFMGGSTNNSIQVCEFSYPIKRNIISIVGGSNLFRVTSSEVKQFAFDNGNATKLDMFNSFLKQNENNEFINFVKKNNKTLVKANGDVIKPIEDVVDSYWIAKFLEKNLNRFII
jgi:hypothetical protein